MHQVKRRIVKSRTSRSPDREQDSCNILGPISLVLAKNSQWLPQMTVHSFRGPICLRSETGSVESFYTKFLWQFRYDAVQEVTTAITQKWFRHSITTDNLSIRDFCNCVGLLIHEQECFQKLCKAFDAQGKISKLGVGRLLTLEGHVELQKHLEGRTANIRI